jgi:transcriptional regulator with XRE-family HTH domain
MTTATPTLGTMLREARHAAGLSQVELSKHTRIDQAHISRLENDKMPLYPALLDTLIAALGLDRDATYHAARRLPAEIRDALAADLPLMREVRGRLGV